ncbi:c-type cytochrome [Moraxella nonliquefaciens]|uniref:Cytochrome c domain-containing protein n=1 Tax=Moraxella nonliquefaciens TaxID=478 RepID=A0A1B8PLP6_MORNO|nr:c-type cytochrome [Moraxella nonliquefaciens]OBX51997.1 hypothetical protein A9Z60_05410 [Moraxella nonliquefaciens]
MKNPSKTLSLLLASAVLLTACGGEKPSEPAKSEPSTQTAPAELADTVPKADEVAITNSATSDKTDKGTVETAQVDNAEQADTAPAPVQALSIAEGKARYEKTCRICHDQGLLDAPKLTAKADWAKRLDKGIDTLHKHSAKGFGKMPAQVTGEVSEAEVYAAVDYMVSQVQ